MGNTVKVTQWPNCDICSTEDGKGVPAYADAKVFGIQGAPWGYVCSECFEQFHCQLGTGYGQMLVRGDD